MAGNIILMLAMLALSMFFSATETAFTSFNRIKLKNLADDNPRAALVIELEEKYDKLLTSILVGNNIANITLSSVATVFCIAIVGVSFGPTLATIAVTVVVLIFGEISPKILAKENADSLVMSLAPVIKVIMVVLTPITAIFGGLKLLLMKAFGNTEKDGFNEDELLTIVDEAKTARTIGEEQSELIANAIEFNDVEAIDVITPRVDIIAIERGIDLDEIRDLFRDSGLSRLPVYEDDLDSIIGVLNYKDFYNNKIEDKWDVDKYIKPVVFVAQSIKAAVLLRKMQTMKTHIAIVVDEYGGTTGLVTMEDIIEEIVGKIYDEHDAVEMKDIIPLGRDVYKVAGGANVEKFFELFDEEIETDVTTINGWIMFQLDKIAEVGDSFTYEARRKVFKVKVTKTGDKRALYSRIQVEDKPEEDD